MSEVKELNEKNLMEVIEDWQFYWMNQTQNSQDGRDFVAVMKSEGLEK